MIKKVKKAISLFKQDCEKYFDNRVIDIIFYGSIVRGGFDPSHSDIDFIVLVNNRLSDKDINWIGNLHTKYRSGKRYQSLLEGRYIGIIDDEFSNGYYIGTNPNGWKPLLSLGLDNLESAMILDKYVSLYNLDIITRLLYFNWASIKDEIHSQIDEFINCDLLDNNDKYIDYALITAARSLYTFIENGFISKPDALMWIEHNFCRLDKKNPKECLKKIKSIIESNNSHP